MLKLTKKQTLGEEIANSISHGILAAIAIALMVILLVRNHSTWRFILGAIIYCLALFFLFLFSCLYHAITHETAKTKILKRLDHIGIYLLIGGTYAPILLNLPTLHIWDFYMGDILIIGQWVLIWIGITCKAIWLRKYHWIHLIIFIVLGWTAVTFIDKVYSFNYEFFWLVVCGGICYTAGVLFYIFPKVKYFHFTWHIAVIIAAILHILAIVIYIY